AAGSSQVTPALPADAVLALFVDPMTDTGRPALLADDHHVGGIDRHVLVDDPALHGLPRGLGVPLGGVPTLDQELVLVGEDTGDARLLAGVLAGDHHHLVSSLQLHHRTSGASETILMNRRSRSSRATGPKIRVPRGCWLLSMMTQALSSNLM